VLTRKPHEFVDIPKRKPRDGVDRAVIDGETPRCKGHGAWLDGKTTFGTSPARSYGVSGARTYGNVVPCDRRAACSTSWASSRISFLLTLQAPDA
jgi:hypothetical protein